jgi:hypothetical protein
MANLTLAIDHDLLQRAREAALREQTSMPTSWFDALIAEAAIRHRRDVLLFGLACLPRGRAGAHDEPDPALSLL